MNKRNILSLFLLGFLMTGCVSIPKPAPQPSSSEDIQSETSSSVENNNNTSSKEETSSEVETSSEEVSSEDNSTTNSGSSSETSNKVELPATPQNMEKIINAIDQKAKPGSLIHTRAQVSYDNENKVTAKLNLTNALSFDGETAKSTEDFSLAYFKDDAYCDDSMARHKLEQLTFSKEKGLKHNFKSRTDVLYAKEGTDLSELPKPKDYKTELPTSSFGETGFKIMQNEFRNCIYEDLVPPMDILDTVLGNLFDENGKILDGYTAKFTQIETNNYEMVIDGKITHNGGKIEGNAAISIKENKLEKINVDQKTYLDGVTVPINEQHQYITLDYSTPVFEKLDESKAVALPKEAIDDMSLLFMPFNYFDYFHYSDYLNPSGSVVDTNKAFEEISADIAKIKVDQDAGMKIYSETANNMGVTNQKGEAINEAYGFAISNNEYGKNHYYAENSYIFVNVVSGAETAIGDAKITETAHRLNENDTTMLFTSNYQPGKLGPVPPYAKVSPGNYKYTLTDTTKIKPSDVDYLTNNYNYTTFGTIQFNVLKVLKDSNSIEEVKFDKETNEYHIKTVGNEQMPAITYTFKDGYLTRRAMQMHSQLGPTTSSEVFTVEYYSPLTTKTTLPKDLTGYVDFTEQDFAATQLAQNPLLMSQQMQ